MNNKEKMSISQAVEKEPAEILSSAAREKFKEIFPHAESKIDSVIDSFIMDVLSSKNIPSSIHHMLPKRQEELLLSVGANSTEEAVKIILSDIPEDILNFYRDKLANPIKKFDVDADIEEV